MPGASIRKSTAGCAPRSGRQMNVSIAPLPVAMSRISSIIGRSRLAASSWRELRACPGHMESSNGVIARSHRRRSNPEPAARRLFAGLLRFVRNDDLFQPNGIRLAAAEIAVNSSLGPLARVAGGRCNAFRARYEGSLMKAVLLTGHGGPEMLRLGDAPDPVAGSGEVVVDIHAASVNAADYKVRLGNGRYRLARFPHILGRDFSGVVSALGAGVGDLALGDAVFGVTEQGVEGAYAEKIAIKAAIVARKPAGLGHVEAAALAITGLTALWALEDTARLRAGETILIQGGAGGVA